MADFSDYYEDQIINHMLRGQAFTVPATIYVALFTALTGLEANDPTAEVSGTGYARKAVTLSAASGGSTSNSAIVDFGTAGAGGWGTVTHFAIVDHETNSTWGTNVNVLMWKALTDSRTINANDEANFAIGALTAAVA